MLSWLLPVAIGLVLAIIIRASFFSVAVVRGDSMKPNLQNSERVGF
ncbi:S26 family signal peptidase [Pediococcus damnosus]